jgi:hypothetical protein
MSSSTGVRLTLKFNFAQKIRIAGWSESYDLAYADLPTAIAASTAISSFIMHRCLCLGVGPYLYSATLTNFVQPATPGSPSPRRASLAFPIPAIPADGTTYNKAFYSGAILYTADFVTTDLYLNCQTNLSTNPVYHRNLWISALPDLADQTDKAGLTNGPAIEAVNVFIGDLKGTNSTLSGSVGFSIRSINRDPAATKNCTAWNLAANTYTVPAHGFAQNQPILAIGMTTVPGGSCPRGTYLVGPPIDANTISLQGASPPNTPVHTGAFRPSTKVFNLVKSVEQIGFTKRNHGRPFGALVGRRSKSRTVRA